MMSDNKKRLFKMSWKYEVWQYFFQLLWIGKIISNNKWSFKFRGNVKPDHKILVTQNGMDI